MSVDTNASTDTLRFGDRPLHDLILQVGPEVLAPLLREPTDGERVLVGEWVAGARGMTGDEFAAYAGVPLPLAGALASLLVGGAR